MKLLDTSCLICAFSELKEPSILLQWKQRGYSLVITDQVFAELSVNKTTFRHVEPYLSAFVVDHTITNQELSEVQSRYLSLGRGECSAIILARRAQSAGRRYYLVIDERFGRRIATEENLQLTGTFGLLWTLLQKGLITAESYSRIKQKFKNSGFRINVDEIENECKRRYSK